ncbi:MAG TPA: MarR family transcriptional regulator [Longimicrobiaceae bacterium]|nr:MarR family transcriptional regulator [Longimicrobiaceae bacterium]
MRTKPSDLEMEAWQALLHAHHEIVGRLDAELAAEHGLGMSDYDVLLRLRRAADRRLRMSDLAERVMISASALTRAVDRLERQGLVRRQRDDADARVVHAELTPEGRERLRGAARTHLRGIREHFTGRLTEDQLRCVASALQVITGPHVPH